MRRKKRQYSHMLWEYFEGRLDEALWTTVTSEIRAKLWSERQSPIEEFIKDEVENGYEGSSTAGVLDDSSYNAVLLHLTRKGGRLCI